MIMLYFAILMRKQHADSLTFFSIFSTRMIPGGRVATLAKFADVLVNRVCVLCAARCAAACPAPPFLLRPLAICCIPLSPLATAASDRLPPRTHTHHPPPPKRSCVWILWLCNFVLLAASESRVDVVFNSLAIAFIVELDDRCGWAPAAGRRARAPLARRSPPFAGLQQPLPMRCH